MIVELKEDIFEQEQFVGLNPLIQICFYQDRHRVLVNYNSICKTYGFNQLSQVDKDILEQQFNAQVQAVEQIPNIEVSEKKENSYFSIDEAIRYLNQPVSIILENNLNDGFFLRAIFKYIDKDKLLLKHYDNGWLQIENAGGCANVDNFIEGKALSFETLPKNKYKYLRCIVVLDSDRNYPTEPLKNEYNILIAKYLPLEIYIHILEKRSMENYLPIEVYPYLEGPIAKRFINAFTSLTPTQIDFYDIRFGFEGKERVDLEIQRANHYKSVSNSNYEVLKNGSGLANFKSSFPKFMDHHQVFSETLQNRTKHQSDASELDNIVNEIKKIL